MSELNRLRTASTALFTDTISQLDADREGGANVLDLLREQAATLADLTFQVVACGEFKRGKSSMLNALVRCPGLFPVDTDIATCVVVSLRYAEHETALAQLVTESGEPTEIQVDVGEIRTFVTEQENPENRRRVRSVLVEAPIESLRSGLVLVDTPGIGGLNMAHDAATHAFLGQADALIFVGDATETFTTVELDFLDRAVAKCPVIITVLTRRDMVVDPAPVVEANRVKIAERTGRPVDEIVVIAVSSTDWFDSLDDDDPELGVASGYPELERELWTRLARSAGARRVRLCLEGLMGAVETVAAPIRVELAADSGAALAKIEAELAVHEEQAKALAADSASWRRDLREAVNEPAKSIGRGLRREFELFETTLNERSAIADDPGDLEEVLHVIARAMIDVVETAMAQLERSASRAFLDFADRTRIPLEPSVTESGFRPHFAVVAPIGERTPDEAMAPGRSLQTIWRSATSGAGLLGIVGGIVGIVGGPVGMAVGAGVGAFVGKILGGIFGWQDSRKEAERKAQADARTRAQRQITAIRDNARAQIRSNLVRAMNGFDDAVDELNRSLTHDLQRQIELARDTAVTTRRKLAQRRERTQAQLVSRRAELEKLDARNTGWLRQAEELVRQADRIERSGEQGGAVEGA